MTSTYAKPFLSIDEQLERLTVRGLAFENRERASRELQAIGYYRLSGYWYPFRQRAAVKGEPRPSEFEPGTTLDEVIEIYRFDERLRAEVLRALSHIEVALRFRIGHLLGRRGPFAHQDVNALDPAWAKSETRHSSGPNCSDKCDWEDSDHDQWIGKQERNEKISNEAFIAHFDSQYGKPLPVWTATEVMSFGDLNRLYNGMTQRDRQQIAVDFDLYLEDGNGDASVLSSWLEHLRQTRNYCAHHARLWNRNHTAPLSIPATLAELGHLRTSAVSGEGAETISRAASRVYGSLVAIAFLLARINESNDVRDSIRSLIEDFSRARPERLHSMGFPLDWDQEVIWQTGYARDVEHARRANMLRNVDLLYTADAAALLTHKSTFAERKSRLGYYRKNGAALSVPGTEAHRYPRFQFDTESGDISPVAIAANRRLLGGTAGSEEHRWEALNWWTSPHPQLPDGTSPELALKSGSLTREILDQVLESRDDE